MYPKLAHFADRKMKRFMRGDIPKRVVKKSLSPRIICLELNRVGNIGNLRNQPLWKTG
jgi:hypothetical protein